MRSIPSQLLLVVAIFTVVAVVNMVPEAKIVGHLPIFQSSDSSFVGPEVPRTGANSAFIRLMKIDRLEVESTKSIPGAQCAVEESRDSYNSIASQISSTELQKYGLTNQLN